MSGDGEKIVILPAEAAAATPHGSDASRLAFRETPPASFPPANWPTAEDRRPQWFGWVVGGLVVATATTMFFIAAVGSGGAPANGVQESILKVFRADEELARRRDALTADATASQTAAAIGRYCDALAAVDMSGCPAEFRVAYRHHIGAWREMQTAMQQLPNGVVEGLLTGVLNSVLRGEADGGQGRLTEALQKASERVSDTWIEVERIGAQHGAAR